jgi:hypothetical protein
MDPITLAIVTAVGSGLAAAAGDVSKQALVDGYAALKAGLARKFGAQSDVVQAAEAVEAKPESDGRKATLEEEVKAAGADQDAELLALAKALVEKIGSTPGGQPISQTATGDGNVQIAGSSGSSVTIHKP